jgi:photosystem II stability/assembly factor-like uncharacterized protein
MAIGLSHGGTTIYSSPSRSNEVLVGTREGIAIIVRERSAWQVAHRALTDRHVSAIIMEPESGLTIAGAFHGSVHVSADSGRTWEPRGNGLTQTNVYSLASTRVDGHACLYAGTEPAHLFVSDDLGLHWTEVPSLRSVPSVPKWSFPAPPHIGHVKHINFDPDNPTTIYASIEVGGLLKSTDAGQSWQEFPELYEDVHRLMVHPSNSRCLYAVTGRGLYVSPDGGTTWKQWTGREDEIGGYPDGFVFCPSDPQLIFMTAAQDAPGTWRTTHFAGARISRSRDGGRSWEILHNGLPDRLQASIEAFCLEESGNSSSIFAATTSGEVFCSEDLGESWEKIISGLAPISKAGHYRNLIAA